jgi:flagellar biosynthesis chaperone FliJ
VVLQTNRNLEMARKKLSEAECRVAVLDKVLEKQKLLMKNKEAQREQRFTDELAATMRTRQSVLTMKQEVWV